MVSLHVFASAPYLVLLGPTWFIFSELVYAGDCFGKHFCTPIYTHLFVFFPAIGYGYQQTDLHLMIDHQVFGIFPTCRRALKWYSEFLHEFAWFYHILHSGMISFRGSPQPPVTKESSQRSWENWARRCGASTLCCTVWRAAERRCREDPRRVSAPSWAEFSEAQR